MTPLPPTYVFDDDTLAFIQGPGAIEAGSRNARNLPSISFAYGSRVAPERPAVTVLLSKTSSTQVLDDVREHGVIAVVYSRPTTHQTIQLKGFDARIDAPCAADAFTHEQYVRGFVDELSKCGYSAAFANAVARQHVQDLVAVTFTPRAAFNQTPGPRAGQRLGYPQ